MSMAMYLLLLIAFILANLPFMTLRLLCIFPMRKKHFGHHFFEWLVYFFLTGFLAYFIEASMSPPHPQNWTFYVAVLCLFAVFAFPGFVLRYFWRQGGKEA